MKQMKTARDVLDYLTELDKSGLDLNEVGIVYCRTLHDIRDTIEAIYLVADSRLSKEHSNVLLIGNFEGDIADYSNE
jgi:hypothetical protein